MNDPQHESSSSELPLKTLTIRGKKKLAILTATGLVSAFVFFSILAKPAFYAALIRGGKDRTVAVSNFLRFISADTPPPLSPPLSGTVTDTPTPQQPTATNSPLPTNPPGRQLELSLHRIMYKDGGGVLSWPDAAVVRYDCQDLRGNSSSGIVSLYVQQPVTVYVPILGNDAFDCTYEELLPQAPTGYVWLETQVSTYSESTFKRTLFTNRLVSMSGNVTQPPPTQPPPATPTSPPPTPTYTQTPTPTVVASKRVFVSSVGYKGNLGGLTGADAKCQSLAVSANLGGTWKAWLSDKTTSAASRLNHHNGPYKRIDGVVVANNWDDLVDSQIQSGIYVTEKGTNYSTQVWSNTTASGARKYGSDNSTCANWTSASTNYWSTTGVTYVTTKSWTDDISLGCSNTKRLYCFEQ